MKTKIFITFFILNLCFSSSYGQDNKKIVGVFTQKIFYRFIIVEFKNDNTFDYNVMSERAHRHTKGKYQILNDTIILNSYETDSDFDFDNEKWIILSRKEILVSNNKNSKKENWAVLKRDKNFSFLPNERSDLSLKIDTIKANELSWIKDTTNYDTELKIIIREPLPPKEPVIVMNGEYIKYQFLLNYYHLNDIDTITFIRGDALLEKGFHGGRTEYGLIMINTKNKNKKTRR